MNHPDYDPSDRCDLCQVKGIYHTPQFGELGKPSEVVVSMIKRRGLNIPYDHEFVRSEPEDDD